MRAFLCLFSGLWLTHPSASYVAPKPKISSGMGTNRETNTDFCTEKLARDLQTRLSSLLLVGSIVASPSCLPPAPLASETGVNAESRSHNSYAVSLERTSVVTRLLSSWGGGAALAAPSDLKGRLDEYGRQYSAVRREKLKEAATPAPSSFPASLPPPSSEYGTKRSGLATGPVSGRTKGGDGMRSKPATERELWAIEMEKDRAVIKVLYAYLEEIERDIFARKWDTLSNYIDVFSKQEAAFVALIEHSFPGQNEANRQATALMKYEAQQIFLQLDDMAEATRFTDVKKAEKAYVGLAIAYDRFLKAGDLYDIYDDTDTSKLYESVPDDMLVYDREAKPVVSEYVLIISGSDKGRTGRLIGISDASGKGVVKVEYGRKNRPMVGSGQGSESGTSMGGGAVGRTEFSNDAPFEVKVVDMANLAKTIPDRPVDAQMKNLMMCPGGVSLTTQGFRCKI